MARLFNKVAIVGVGLIGGSLGIAIKEKRLAREVVGISRRQYTLNTAKRLKAIDEGYLELKTVGDCDLVILCTPVKTIINIIPKIAPYLSCGCIVTDVGSTKFEIVKAAQKFLPKNIEFIGTHPLAGSEKRGIRNANKKLFDGSVCILTPSKANHKKNIDRLRLFWKRLGATVRILNPCLHDKILSVTSQLPHLIAFSLIGTIPSGYLQYGSSGLKDSTRIASSDPLLWAEIFLSNRKQILNSIATFKKQLSDFGSLIENKNEKQLFAKIKYANLQCDKLNIRNR